MEDPAQPLSKIEAIIEKGIATTVAGTSSAASSSEQANGVWAKPEHQKGFEAEVGEEQSSADAGASIVKGQESQDERAWLRPGADEESRDAQDLLQAPAAEKEEIGYRWSVSEKPNRARRQR